MLNRLKPKSEFSRNVLTLMTGTTIAQAIPIAISPILTRIYTPEDFGVFALYMSVASLLSVMATGRYELAIMLPKKDEDAVNIVALSIIIAFFVSFISFLIVFIFNAQITNLLGNPEISSWLYFIPVTVLLTGIYQSLNYWSNRKKEYKRLATSRVVQSGTTATSNLALGFTEFTSSGLIFSSILGQGIATGILSLLIYKNNKKIFIKITKTKILFFLKKYIDFPKYSIFSDLLTTANSQLAILFLANLFSISVVGFFSFASRIVSVPTAILSSSIGDVFRQEATKSYVEDHECESIYVSTLKKLIFLGFIPFLIIYLFSPLLFELLFGSTWREGGVYASILAPMLFLQFVSSPLSMMYYIAQKQKYYLWFIVLMFTSSIVLFLSAYIFTLNIALFLQLYSYVYGFFYLLNIAITYSLSKKRG